MHAPSCGETCRESRTLMRLARPRRPGGGIANQSNRYHDCRTAEPDLCTENRETIKVLYISVSTPELMKELGLASSLLKKGHQ
eukprot:7569931-Pyramimonas_sp.AAC.1